jgi:hypothetical protein
MILASVVVASVASFAGAQTTIDGVIYLNASRGLTKDTTFSPAAARNNFDVDRVYLNWRNRSEGGISSRVTLDVDGRKAQANQLSFLLKYAYVAWQPEGSALTWKLGLQNTPIVGFTEDIWGYRMQGKVAMDRAGYLSSSDFGLAVEGGWRQQAVNFDAGLFNGETYSRAPGDNRKDVAGRVSVRLLATDDQSKVGGLRLTGFAQLGQATGGADRRRVLGMLSYRTTALALGAEYAVTRDSTAASAETDGRVMSLWGAYQRPESKFGLMARMDRWDPDTDLNPASADLTASEQTRLIGGVSYRLAKNVRLLFDADIASLQHGPGPNSFEAANRTLFVHAEIKF